MSIISYPFIFIDRDAVTTDGIVFDIMAKDLKCSQELFDHFGQVTGGWNTYFGSNWDGFYDVFCDLQWITEYHIVVYLHQLPFIDPKNNQELISVLIDVEKNWLDANRTQYVREASREEGVIYPHRVQIVWSPTCRPTVTSLMKEYYYTHCLRHIQHINKTLDAFELTTVVESISKDHYHKHFLENIGFGMIGSCMLYSDATSVSSVFGNDMISGLPESAMLIADDMAGTCFALDNATGVIWSISDDKFAEQYADNFVLFLHSELLGHNN